MFYAYKRIRFRTRQTKGFSNHVGSDSSAFEVFSSCCNPEE